LLPVKRGIADNVDYCFKCGYAISEKAKKEQLEKEIERINAEKFKLTVENKKKEDKIKKLESEVVDIIKEIDNTLPSKTFEHFNDKKEKEKYTYGKSKVPSISKKDFFLIVGIVSIVMAIAVCVCLKFNILDFN